MEADVRHRGKLVKERCSSEDRDIRNPAPPASAEAGPMGLARGLGISPRVSLTPRLDL